MVRNMFKRDKEIQTEHLQFFFNSWAKYINVDKNISQVLQFWRVLDPTLPKKQHLKVF